MSQNNKPTLFVLPTDDMGGAEGVLKIIAEFLISQEDPVRVLCLTQKNTGAWDDPMFNTTYMRTGNTYLGMLALLLAGIRGRYSRVYSSQVYINGTLGLLRRINRMKTDALIVRESTSIFLRYPKGLKRFSFEMFYFLGYKGADMIIHQSDLMKTQLLDNLKFLRKYKHAVLSNPMNLLEVREKGKGNEAVPNFPYILCVGRLIKAKGFDVAINAFNSICSAFPEMHLVLLGSGADEESLQNMAKDLNLQDRVHLLGYKSNPYPYMKAASLCAMTSRLEGYPNVLLQMLALNNRVISTLCAGGIEDLPLRHIVPIDNHTLLGDAMIAALSEQPLSRTEIDKVLALRSPKNFVDQVEFVLIG